MIRKSLVFVLFFVVVASQPVFAQCPVPQLKILDSNKIHYTGEKIHIHVNHAQNVKVEFKFDYRNINVKLFGQPNPYQTDYATKVADVVETETTLDGTITENQSGFWKAYARSRCTLGQPNKMAPQPTAVSDWSAPVEFIYLNQGTDGIFASVKVEPAAFSGMCPVTIFASARIQAYYPNTTVNYSWLLSDGQTAPGGTLTFNSQEIKDTGTIGFPVGTNWSGGGSSGYKDPPHSGLIYLVVNGKKAFPMPGAGYQVKCTQDSMGKSRIKQKLP